MDRFGSVDHKDLQIIEALQINARIPLSKLGRQIGLSQPAISERVRRLEETGIIEGYGARINARALGLGMMAIMRIRTTHDARRTNTSRLASGGSPRCRTSSRCTG